MDLHYKDKSSYHVKNDPMRIIVHYDSSVDRYKFYIASYTKLSYIEDL